MRSWQSAQSGRFKQNPGALEINSLKQLWRPYLHVALWGGSSHTIKGINIVFCHCIQLALYQHDIFTFIDKSSIADVAGAFIPKA